MTPAEFRAALKQLGLSQREAGRLLGVPPSSIHRWLTGKRPIRGPTASCIKCWLRLAAIQATDDAKTDKT